MANYKDDMKQKKQKPMDEQTKRHPESQTDDKSAGSKPGKSPGTAGGREGHYSDENRKRAPEWSPGSGK